jgi:hypothetical protein
MLEWGVLGDIPLFPRSNARVVGQGNNGFSPRNRDIGRVRLSAGESLRMVGFDGSRDSKNHFGIKTVV